MTPMEYEFEPACRRMEGLDPFYKQVWEKAFQETIPITGTFELTARCNFNCRMCYVHLQPEQIPKLGAEMSAADWIRAAREAREAGTAWLCVTGGEPLMHPEFETIWKELSRMGFFITLQTNASLIRGKTAELLAEYPPRLAKVSLYGSDDAVYREVCRVEQGFTRAEQGIRTLREIGISVELVSPVIRQNQGDIKKMAFFAYQHHLPWIPTGQIRGSVRGADSQAGEARVQEKLDLRMKEQIRFRLRGHPVDRRRKVCAWCRDYRLGYWITWNGEMRFCGFMGEPRIPVRSQSFRQAWEQLIRFEEELDWPEQCRDCRARSVCLKCAGEMACEPVKEDSPSCGKIRGFYDEIKEEEAYGNGRKLRKKQI